MDREYAVYCHKNKINGKCYVGKSQRVTSRWSNEGGSYKLCPRFWSAIVHYGWDNFEHIIIEDNLTKEEAEEKEKYYIIQYNSLYPNGYNLTSGGTGGNVWEGKTQEEKDEYAQQRRIDTLSRGEEWHKKLSESQKKAWSEGRRTHSGKKPYTSKKCRCVETGIVYESLREAALACGKSRHSGSHIGQALGNKERMVFGFHWEEVK